jgi:hypothetical protein
MTFRDAVAATPGLEYAYQPGLQALRRRDRRRIQCEEPRKLAGSVDLDTTLWDSHANDARWDYGIGVRKRANAEVVLWVEVHPASSLHIGEVLSKLQWLKGWLRSSARRLRAFPARYLWVSSGKVTIPAGSRQRRRLAAAGIRLVGERLEL